MEEPDVIVDTCCLINLAAAGDLGRLLPASGLKWHLPRSIEAQGVAIRMTRIGEQMECLLQNLLVRGRLTGHEKIAAENICSDWKQSKDRRSDRPAS